MRVTVVHYPVVMAPKVWTAAEIEKLTPAEQDALFDESIVSDLSKVPREFIAGVRARLGERIANETSDRR